MMRFNLEQTEHRGRAPQVFCVPVSVFFTLVDRLGSDWDATVTGGTSIVREEKKNIRAKGPVSLQPGYVAL